MEGGLSSQSAHVAGRANERSASPLSRREHGQRNARSPSHPPPAPNQANGGAAPDDGDDAMEGDDLPSLRELENELDDGLQDVDEDGPNDRRQDFQLKRQDLPADISGFKVRLAAASFEIFGLCLTPMSLDGLHHALAHSLALAACSRYTTRSIPNSTLNIRQSLPLHHVCQHPTPL